MTAILPHSGNLFREKVPGAVFVGNAFGKLAGSTQVNELGEIETPLLLTSTLSVPRVADALLDYMLALLGNEDVESINPLVGETNDGYLSDTRGRHITREDVFAAIKTAKGGPVEEGSVGAGHRNGRARLQGRHWNFLPPPSSPAGRVHGRGSRPDQLRWRAHHGGRSRGQGTGPPLPARRASAGRQRDRSGKWVGDGRYRNRRACRSRNLKRMAARAMLGLGRTGAAGSNGSGDSAIAFSTAPQLWIRSQDKALTREIEVLQNDAMSPLFLAVIEATEEAVYNSLLKATTVT
ncbi:MAG TPA: P1 family peptidase, partial [Terriglobales bacterium]|nr:P1 family peptidase [Terriglobales bacterium]